MTTVWYGSGVAAAHVGLTMVTPNNSCLSQLVVSQIGLMGWKMQSGLVLLRLVGQAPFCRSQLLICQHSIPYYRALRAGRHENTEYTVLVTALGCYDFDC